MRDEKQSILTAFDPDKPPGDCWRCCIAALLNMKRDDVPHFYDQTQFRSAEADAQEWLNARGYFLMSIPNGIPVYCSQWAGRKDGLDANQPFIASGPTVRSKRRGQLHATLYYGDTMIYDPHPDESGLLAIVHREFILPILPGVWKP